VSVTDAVSALIASQGDLSALQATQAAVALRLAAVLDNGQGVMAFAAISKELRECLADLTGSGDEHDEFADFLAGLSAPMGHAADAK
jgi:hypothetical protein